MPPPSKAIRHHGKYDAHHQPRLRRQASQERIGRGFAAAPAWSLRRPAHRCPGAGAGSCASKRAEMGQSETWSGQYPTAAAPTDAAHTPAMAAWARARIWVQSAGMAEPIIREMQRPEQPTPDGSGLPFCTSTRPHGTAHGAFYASLGALHRNWVLARACRASRRARWARCGLGPLFAVLSHWLGALGWGVVIAISLPLGPRGLQPLTARNRARRPAHIRARR